MLSAAKHLTVTPGCVWEILRYAQDDMPSSRFLNS